MQRIAIIGGGAAGLITAQLLDPHHHVTLFERDGRFGGHAETVSVELEGSTRLVDAGVHYFSEQLQPKFCDLLRRIGVPFERYDPSITFFDLRDAWTVCMPPIGSLARARGLLQPKTVRALLAMRRLINASIDLVEKEGDLQLTVEQLVGGIDLSDQIRREFVYPYLGAYWGVSADEVRSYSARNVMSYLVRLRPPVIRPPSCYRMVGGMKAYIERLTSLITRTKLERSTGVRSIQREQSGYVLEVNGAQTASFDHVVLATNALHARELLDGLSGAEAVREVLGTIEYFETTIAIHGDVSLLPPRREHWSIMNSMYDGQSALITNRELPNDDIDLFRSWITHRPRKPDRLYAEVKYLHPRPTPAYFTAQQLLGPLNGRDNLWFAGMYVDGYDNHDGAITSAERIAVALTR